MKTLPALAALCFPLLACRAADYQGADAVLKQVAASASDPSYKPTPARQWQDDLARYREHAAALPPEESARLWIDLFERAVRLPAPEERRFGGSSAPRPQAVLQVLPPPAAWDALAVQAAALGEPEKGSTDFAAATLRIITATLQNQPTAVRWNLDTLRVQISGLEGSPRAEYGRYEGLLRETFLRQTGDGPSTLALFEARLARLRSGAAPAAGEEDARASLDVPDLVSLAGAARAEALLKEVFTLNLQGVAVSGETTQALARRVALENADRLKFAPWELADTLDAVALYDALDRRFPGPSADPTVRRLADAYHVLGLIAAGRTEEAARLAVKVSAPERQRNDTALDALPQEALGTLAERGYAREVYRFLDGLLAGQPALPYWSSYISAAVLAGETDPMLVRVRAASERSGLKPRERDDLRHSYGDALLAADHVAEALPILREWASQQRVSDSPVNAEIAREERHQAARAHGTLAGVARRLGDTALLNEQLDALVALATAQPDALESVYVPGDENLNETFLAAGRGPDMERLLAAGWTQRERTLRDSVAKQKPGGALDREAEHFRQIASSLLALTDLYYQAGRYADVVALLDDADGWGVPDLAKLVASGGEGTPFLLEMAHALQKTGRPEAALRLVNAYLDKDGGKDLAYSLLLELASPEQAEARLDEVFRGDGFEERPLIWRAVLQLSQGRLDEAEKSARQAISIDPSDGEQGRGNRLRAYAVLGDILERKGDTEKAAQMRQAVRAIRLSEDADQFRYAGLLTRAAASYEKALGYFADAYCIQSRLAIQLTALGKLDEAAMHYERAYELMPESFGRMESHCFGCEKAFAGARAQNAAERVFLKLVAQQPANPRVHYLLGYLRMEQDRKPEAAREFAEAVKLDPDYINAWKQLAANTNDPAARDHAALNLLRLDPRQRHDSVDAEEINDLRGLWAATEASAKSVPPPPASLYPLAASATFLRGLRERFPLPPAAVDEDGEPVESTNWRQERFMPRAVVLKNRVIDQAVRLLIRSENSDLIVE